MERGVKGEKKGGGGSEREARGRERERSEARATRGRKGSLSLHFSLEDFSRAAESFLVSIYSVAPPPSILAPFLCVEK